MRQSRLAEARMEIVNGVMLGGEDFVRPLCATAVGKCLALSEDAVQALEHKLPVKLSHLNPTVYIRRHYTQALSRTDDVSSRRCAFGRFRIKLSDTWDR